MVTGWLVTAMVLGGVPAVRQDARGAVAQGAGFSLRVNVVERPSLKDRAPDPNHKPDAALFEQATVMLKRAWPAYEALFHAFLTQPHPYRSTFQAHVARDGQKVTQAGEPLRTIILEKGTGIPFDAPEFLVDPCPELSINIHYQDNPTYRFGDTIILKLLEDFVNALPFLQPQVRAFCSTRSCPGTADLPARVGGGEVWPWHVVSMVAAQGLDASSMWSNDATRAVIARAWLKQEPLDPAWVTSLTALPEASPQSNGNRARFLGELLDRMSPAQVKAGHAVVKQAVDTVEKVYPIPWVSTPVWAYKKLNYSAP